MLYAPKNPTSANVPASIREQAAGIKRPFTGHRPVIGVMYRAHAALGFWAIRMQLGDVRDESDPTEGWRFTAIEAA